MSKKKINSEVAAALCKLAVSLADEAQADNVIVDGEGPGKPMLSFDQKLAVFKALTSYYIGVVKVKSKIPDEDEEEDGETFTEFTRKLKAVK